MFANGLSSYLLRKVTDVMLAWIDIVLGQYPFHANHVLALGIVGRLLACRKSVELINLVQLTNFRSPSLDPLVDDFQ